MDDQNNTSKDPVVDGEIVENASSELETAEPVQVTEDATGAGTLASLEGTIKQHVATIDKLQLDIRTHREMLDDVFTNDPVFKEHSEKAKEANKVKSQTKSQIMKRPQIAQLSEKIKDMRAQIKDLEDALSEYLQEYRRLSGVDEIEGEDGEMRKIVYKAKLVKHNQYRP